MTPAPAKRAILIVLVSLVAAWLLAMAASFTDLFVQPVYVDGIYRGDDPAVRPSTYLVFAAVAVVAVAVVIAQRLAIRVRLDRGVDALLPRAAHRFTTLMIVIVLAFAAILGVAAFLSGFPGRSEIADMGVRILGTYLPILAYTAVIVTVLLLGFVFRKDSLPKSSALREGSAPEPVEGSVATPAPDPRFLGGAYAVPIVAVAVALIFGLIVYDITHTRLELWIWVIIHVIVATGIIAGTVFAQRAMAESADWGSARSRITRSAGTMNFVLSVVFIAVVSVMAFSTGSNAITGLRISPSLSVDIFPGPSDLVQDVVVSVNGWDLTPDSVVTVTLEPGGQAIITGEVGSYRDFYGQENLPASLTPGDYVLEASAVAIDGSEITRTARFSVNDDSTVEMKSLVGFAWQEPDTTILSPSFSWAIREMLPALTMLVIGLATTSLTLTRRNREPVTSG
jgi:hypothetical protein